MGTAAAIGGGLLGGIAGSQADTTVSRVSTNLSAPGELETEASRISLSQLQGLEGLTGAGAGQQDVTAGLESQRSLADLLQGLTQTGGLPGQEDIAAAQAFTTDIFAPQTVALQQAFEQQQQRTAQQAARLGRSVSDPILQAKLAQEQTRQQQTLQAQQTSFRAQQARNLPLQRLGFAGALADVRQGLASQAFSNRQNLFALGQTALRGEQSFRGQVAERVTTGISGGGLGGAISGGLAGAGAGLGAAGALQSLGGGGLATGATQINPFAALGQQRAVGGPQGGQGISTGFLLG